MLMFDREPRLASTEALCNRLLTTQIMIQTTGTVVATEIDPDQGSDPPPFNLGVSVQWDNDGSVSHLNNIALEPLASETGSAGR